MAPQISVESIRSNLANILDRLAAAFFPCRCVLCDEVTYYDDIWCGKCEYKSCGLVDCGDLPHSFISAAAAFEYSGNVSRAIWRIKRKRDKRTLLFFAEEMRRTALSSWPGQDFDMVVPVPLSPSKLKLRGFNQSGDLASALSGLIDVPVCEDALKRHDDSMEQHSLDYDERLLNAAKSYEIGTADVSGKTILLVDDVITTGATLAACSGKLAASGAKSVYAITAANPRYRLKNPINTM